VHGVPVLLRDDVGPGHDLWRTTPTDVARLSSDPAAAAPLKANTVDWFVEGSLVATCGNLYRGCKTPLARYPLPALKLPPGDDRIFLDVGSNWGRWALAAAQLGYRAVAIDPSLDAVLAGARVARQLGVHVDFLVADARHLPFRDRTADVVFSYSVLQHLDKQVARDVLEEIARVGRAGGLVRIQMANRYGIRQLANRTVERIKGGIRTLARERREPYHFRVRHWTPAELRRTFTELVGPTTVSVDGFLSLNARATDLDLLKPSSAAVVQASEALCRLSAVWPGLSRLADSVFVDAVNRAEPPRRRST
jgi:SAM-dependent methyltransferase